MTDPTNTLPTPYQSGRITNQLYAVIFDPEGYHTLKALFQSEYHAKKCARTLNEVVGDHCEVVPWEV